MGFQAAFYKGTRPGIAGGYNLAVRVIDNGPYSHNELIFSDGMSGSASWVDGGVRLKRIIYDPARWDFLDLPPELEAAARQWFIDHDGEPYDLRGNIRFLCGVVRESKIGKFCSEAQMGSLGFSEPWRYGPNGAAAILRDFARIRMSGKMREERLWYDGFSTQAQPA